MRTKIDYLRLDIQNIAGRIEGIIAKHPEAKLELQRCKVHLARAYAILPKAKK